MIKEFEYYCLLNIVIGLFVELCVLLKVIVGKFEFWDYLMIK